MRLNTRKQQALEIFERAACSSLRLWILVIVLGVIIDLLK